VLALALLAAVPTATGAASMPIAEADPMLWSWLPHGENMWEPHRRRLAADAPLSSAEMFELPAARRADHSGPRANVVYDPGRHLVLYWNGCCDWQETVLARVTARPPKPLRTAPLGDLRTRRGIALGASPAAVVRAYGPTRLHRSTTTPALRVLSYYRDQHVPGSGCGWYENFVFSADRLIEIQAGHSC
jgi:hypothetical protein